MWSQIIEITLMNLRNIGARAGSSSVIVVGIAGVVAVLVGLLSMSTGFQRALVSAGEPDRALIMRAGSNGEMSSNLSSAEVNVLSTMEGIDLVSPELYVVVGLPKKTTGDPANVIVRGITFAGFDLRREARIVEGRRFDSGRNEIVVGVNAASEFAGLAVGEQVDLREGQWTVVGHFEAGGSAMESEIWIDLKLAQAIFRRGGSMSLARVRMDDRLSMSSKPGSTMTRGLNSPSLQKKSSTAHSLHRGPESSIRSALL